MNHPFAEPTCGAATVSDTRMISFISVPTALEISVVPIPANPDAIRIRSVNGASTAVSVAPVNKAVAPGWMRDNARQGIAWYEDGKAGDGVTAQTVREAREMASGNVTADKAGRMAAWFARHMGDLDAPAADPSHPDYPSPGVVAHALWGGGSRSESERAASWARAHAKEASVAETKGAIPYKKTPLAPEAQRWDGPREVARAKTINFAILYGISRWGLAGRLDVSPDEAQAMIDRYFERFPGISRYIADTLNEAKERGYTQTLFGRKTHFPRLKSPNPNERGGSERAAINAPIQGTCADIIKRAMTRMAPALDEAGLTQVRMLMQVHDELVFELPHGDVAAATTVIRRVMETAAEPAVTLTVPLGVDIGTGPSWGAAH